MEETEQERADRLAREAKKKSVFDYLNPLNWFSGGGFFDTIGSIFGLIIPVLIFAPVLYFVAKSDWAQEMIGKWLDDDPAKGKAKVKGFLDKIDAGLESFLSPLGITMFDGATERLINNANAETARGLLVDHSDGFINAEMAQLIAPDDSTWKDNLALFKKCGGDFKKPDSFKTPAFRAALADAAPTLAAKLYDAMLRNPAAASAMAAPAAAGAPATAAPGAAAASGAAAPAPASGATSSLPSDIQMMLMGGSALDELVGTAGKDKATRVSNMGTVLSIIRSQSQSTLTLDPEKMLALLDAVGMKDGKTTPEFRNYLIAAASTDANGKSRAMSATLAFLRSPAVQTSPNAAPAIAAVAQSIDPTKIEDPETRKQVEQLRALGTKGTKAALDLIGSGIKVETEIAFFKNASAAATQNLVNHLLDADDLRAKLRQPGNLYDLGVLLDTQKPATLAEKQALDFIRTRAPGEKVNYQNIGALMTLVDAIDKKGNDTENKQMLGQLMALMRAPDNAARQKAISTINPNSFASFMRNHAPEFGVFLKQMNNGTLTPEQRTLINGLRKTFGTTQEGIAEVLADPNGAKFILDAMANPSDLMSKIAKLVPDALKGTSDAAATFYFKTIVGGKVGENSQYILGLMHTITPGATPARPAGGNARS